MPTKNKSTPVTFGQVVREMRDDEEWTQYRLAKEAGISATYLAELEIDEKGPSLEIAAKIAKAFGVGLAVFDDVYGL